jgi:aerobic carbon-monoxide dehydrogenase small subunit
VSIVQQPAARHEIGVSVNGAPVRREVDVRRLLVDFLRDDLELTGTHAGCEHGICGACTILIDGEPARSCITLAVQVDGSAITTVEGVTPPDGLGPVQQAFKECHALQCGFCTPGFIMTLHGADPADYPDEDHLRELLAGNLCRCTGYEHIVQAVRRLWGRAGDDPAGVTDRHPHSGREPGG